MHQQIIMTVTGPMDAGETGLWLTHEHILTDLRLPAEQTVDYTLEQVIKRMTPYLMDIKAWGVNTLVECTPMYVGRRADILRTLSLKTGIRILTNTGQYKEPFLPPETYEKSAAELATDWIREINEGIEGGIRPGFIKTAVPSDGLAPVNETVIRAAAITCLETGLTIGTHTGTDPSAARVAAILREEGVPLSKWIFIHAQNEKEPERLLGYAGEGAYISLDGLSESSADRHLAALRILLDHGFGDQILLSHDAGWYRPGQSGGGTVRGYTYLFDSFIPYAAERGVDRERILSILTGNARRAFAIGNE